MCEGARVFTSREKKGRTQNEMEEICGLSLRCTALRRAQIDESQGLVIQNTVLMQANKDARCLREP